MDETVAVSFLSHEGSQRPTLEDHASANGVVGEWPANGGRGAERSFLVLQVQSNLVDRENSIVEANDLTQAKN